MEKLSENQQLIKLRELCYPVVNYFSAMEHIATSQTDAKVREEYLKRFGKQAMQNMEEIKQIFNSIETEVVSTEGNKQETVTE
jgi:hypothetical protein